MLCFALNAYVANLSGAKSTLAINTTAFSPLSTQILVFKCIVVVAIIVLVLVLFEVLDVLGLLPLLAVELVLEGLDHDLRVLRHGILQVLGAVHGVKKTLSLHEIGRCPNKDEYNEVLEKLSTCNYEIFKTLLVVTYEFIYAAQGLGDGEMCVTRMTSGLVSHALTTPLTHSCKEK